MFRGFQPKLPFSNWKFRLIFQNGLLRWQKPEVFHYCVQPKFVQALREVYSNWDFCRLDRIGLECSDVYSDVYSARNVLIKNFPDGCFGVKFATCEENCLERRTFRRRTL
jgi:hypothetical protein